MEKSPIRIKKIKYSDSEEKISMTFEKLVNDQYDEYQFTSSEEAAPEFYDALKALVPHAIELLELPKKDIGRCHVYGVRFTYTGEAETMGAIMNVKRDLIYTGSCTVLNTQAKKCSPGDEEYTDDNYFTEECVTALWALERECRAYINGKRNQISLFGDNGETEAPSTDKNADTDQIPQEELDAINNIAAQGSNQDNVVPMAR